MLAEKPANPAGTKFVYSNVGYTIVGAMAERKTGAAWENLVRREVSSHSSHRRRLWSARQ